jgi:hypothetical protein
MRLHESISFQHQHMRVHVGRDTGRSDLPTRSPVLASGGRRVIVGLLMHRSNPVLQTSENKEATAASVLVTQPVWAKFMARGLAELSAV